MLTAGIDVGGTNTDGVLFDPASGSIVRSVKIPTRHTDYELSVEEALRALLDGKGADGLCSVNISTTLATNALLEKKGSPVSLILIGYGDFPHVRDEILRIIPVPPASLLEIRGGHNGWGKEREPLDLRAAERFAEEHRGEFFAVSSYYSPRNPEHEQRTASILRTAGCAGITCGHEIARSRLNSVRRTVTAFLNSSLMTVAAELIASVNKCAKRLGIGCPVMFLRSDSTLVSSGWCLRFPIETVFSGPAASMRGAMLLGGVKDGSAVIADMGGTSTDIGIVKDGAALYSERGAVIGDYVTMIPSLEIRSVALGGDSRVEARCGRLTIGPERVVPICRGGDEYTPSDALCCLGLYDPPGGARKNPEAAAKLPAALGLPPKKAAEAVRAAVASKLRENLDEAGGGAVERKICVGAPISAFADESCAVPEHASIASAVGAASSPLVLSFSAAIVRSFADNTFSAFLPARCIRSADLEALRREASAELKEYLASQARQMGFEKAEIAISETCEYIGPSKDAQSIAAVTLNARAVS